MVTRWLAVGSAVDTPDIHWTMRSRDEVPEIECAYPERCQNGRHGREVLLFTVSESLTKIKVLIDI